ncbi:MAG: DUF1302 family protein [Pseudomonadota bacterium]
MNKVRAMPRRGRAGLTGIAAVSATLLAATPAYAAELANNESYSVRLDNTLKYSAGVRTNSQDQVFLGNPNVDDGDRSFNKNSLITNRVDWLGELDASIKDKAGTGFRLSVAGWYDAVYLRDHAGVPAATFNQYSVAPNEFTRTARKVAGRSVEVLDAFVHSGVDLGGHDLSFRLGRHTLLWGESLFFTTNGIVQGQAPIDANSALTVPNILAKQVFMPVNQASFSLSVNPSWSLQAYKQLEYRETRVSPPGTFFSTADLVFQGAERIIVPRAFGTANGYLYRGADQRPSDTEGQWGVAAKFADPNAGVDVGLYYLRYSDKTPQIYAAPGAGFNPVTGQIGTFNFIYPRKIELFGVSASTTVGDANVAGEISLRRNMPLISNSSALVLAPGVDADHPLHAVGRTLHFQASTIWVVPRSPLWETGSLLAEVGGHHLLDVTSNASARDPLTGDTAFGARVVFEPKWYQVAPSLDVSVPIGLRYNFHKKRSPIDPSFNGGEGPHGGQFNIGLNWSYATLWRGGLSLVRELGAASTNNYKDRNFVVMNAQYTF